MVEISNILEQQNDEYILSHRWRWWKSKNGLSFRPKGAACYISQTSYIGDYSLSHRTGLSYRNSVEPVHLVKSLMRQTICAYDEADHEAWKRAFNSKVEFKWGKDLRRKAC